MTPRRTFSKPLVTSVALVAAIVASVVCVSVAVASIAAPRSIGTPLPPAATGSSLPDGPSPAACVTVAGCDVYAKHGTVTPPSAGAIDIWGYTFNAAPNSGELGGTANNTIVMSTTDTLTINLHNDLPAGAGNLSLEVPASAATPDQTGTAVSTVKTYTFTGLAPGTYVYQAGSTVEQPRQLAMGLAALIIVRPTGYLPSAKSAYASGAVPFADEAIVAFNEIDPNFNADPLNRDVEDFTPQYFFVNGKSYPNTDDIGALAGDVVLLRAANLGIRDRALGLLNARMTEVGRDSRKLANPPGIETELLTPGEVADVTTLVDPSAPVGSQFPLMDLGRNLNNGAQAGLGGMLTLIDVVGGPAGGGPAGPVAKVTDLAPATNDGTKDEDVTVSYSGPAAASAKWFLDKIQGAGHPFPNTNGTHTIPVADILSDGPMTGDHVIWVVPYDGGAVPGTPSGDVFTLALAGPTISGLAVDPAFTNLTSAFNKTDDNPPGSTNVIITGATTPSLVDYAVDGALLCIDAPACGSPLTMNVAAPLPPSHTHALSASVPASAFNALSNGGHLLYVQTHEVPVPPATLTPRNSTWGQLNSSVNIVIDRNGPTTTIDAANSVPNPAGIGDNPGNLNFLASTRLQVNISDTLSPIADAEVFLDYDGPNLAANDIHYSPHGTGSQLRPLVGQWLDDPTSHTKSAFIDMPTAELLARPQGPMHVFVSAKDAAGNWGPSVDYVLNLDKTNPVVKSAAESSPKQHEFNPDETGAPVITGGHITISACDPNGVSADPNCVQPPGVSLLGPPNVPVTSKITEIRYWVVSQTGTIGQPGAGIFYQQAQRVGVPSGTQSNQLVNFNFEWHEVKEGLLPWEPVVGVWVWGVDGAGNASVPVLVNITP